MTGRADAALGALAAGAVDRFAGLPGGLRFDDVDAAFGDPGEGPNGLATFNGEPLSFRHYPASGAAAAGLTAYAALPGEDVVALRIPAPQLRKGSVERLGVPGLVLPSGLAPFHEQEVWPERGLALHREDAGPRDVLQLAAFRPTTAEGYRESWLSRISVERRLL